MGSLTLLFSSSSSNNGGYREREKEKEDGGVVKEIDDGKRSFFEKGDYKHEGR